MLLIKSQEMFLINDPPIRAERRPATSGRWLLTVTEGGEGPLGLAAWTTSSMQLSAGTY